MITLFFLGFLLLAFLWNQYYARHWSQNLMVTLRFLQGFVYAGDQTEMTEQIENRKKLVLPVLEVGFHVDKRLAFHDCENTSVSDFTYKRDIFALLGNQRITRKLTLNCAHRGYYRIDKSYLTTFSMLHRRRFSAETQADTELYVYAARTNVSDILVTCERLMGSVQCAKRLFEDPFAYASIREYTITDPMKTINWKASARTGSLMVNTFESTHMEKVMIFLDVEDSGILKYECLTEDSISVAASLAQKMIAKGMEVGLCTNIVSAAATMTDIAVNRDPYPQDTCTLSFTASIPRGVFCECSKAEVTENPRIAAPKCDSGAFCVHHVTMSGHAVNSNTCTYLTPAGGRKQLSDIERLLAGHKADTKTVPLPNILDSFSGLAEDCVLIFISKNTLQNQQAIETFVGREQQAVWVIPHLATENCDIHTAGNLCLIKRGVYDA